MDQDIAHLKFRSREKSFAIQKYYAKLTKSIIEEVPKLEFHKRS